MTGFLGVVAVYEEQVNIESMSLPIYALVASIMIFLAFLGICFIDVGFVRRKMVLDTWVQKFVAGAGGGIGWLIIGMPLWMWQFNQAYEVPNGFTQAFKDWWFAGKFVSTYAQDIDPAVLPQADVMQMFFILWMAYCIAFAALMQGAWLERMKALPLFIFSITIGIVMAGMGYLTWGPTSFLTNNGFHEFLGVTVGYIPVGVFALVIQFYLKPRLGAFEPHPSGSTPGPHNEGFVAVGVLMLLCCVPFVACTSVYMFPGEGVYGINMTTTGIGVVAINCLYAITGGMLAGVILAYLRKEAIWALVGPIVGLICAGPGLELEAGWQAFLFGMAGMVMVLLGYKLCMKFKIDDAKVVPLTILPALFGQIVHGFVFWGTPSGGYPGLEGEFALQQSVITPWWQLVGLAIVIGVTAVVALVVGFIVQKTIGVRKDERSELAGDLAIWGQSNYGEEPGSVIEYGQNI